MNTPTADYDQDPELKQPEENKAAPLWKRFMAILYDSFLVVAISMGYGAAITALAAFQSNSMTQDYSPTVSGLGFQLGWVLTLFLFYCYFWRKAGQTVGMKAWRLKIISNNSERLSMFQCVIRFVAGFIGFVLLGIGFWWAIFDKQKATLHDKLSNSGMVITPKMNKRNTKKASIPDANARK